MGRRAIRGRTAGRCEAARAATGGGVAADGVCTVTDTGPVQVLYEDAGHGRRVFESAARVGC